MASSIPVEVTFEGTPVAEAPRLLDITPVGAFVEADHLVGAGAAIELHFSLPESEELQVTGIVKWSGERGPTQGMGVVFSGLEKQARIALYKHCRPTLR